jgi:putative endonuclease
MPRLDEAARRRAQRRGQRAETLCVLALRLKGYRILARRFRTPLGEIDILARRGGVLAVIEVKARPDHAGAALALGPRQRRRIAAATQLFLARNHVPHHSLRFDVMLVTPRRWPRHLINAWSLP